MRRSADSDHRSQGSSVQSMQHSGMRISAVQTHHKVQKNTVQYIGQRDSDGKSVSHNRILCFIFFTQILHSGGENFTIDRYYENR